MFCVPTRDTSLSWGSPVTAEVTWEGRHRPAELPRTHVRLPGGSGVSAVKQEGGTFTRVLNGQPRVLHSDVKFFSKGRTSQKYYLGRTDLVLL